MSNKGDKIVLVGGGGHCKSVIDSILRLKRFTGIAITEKEKQSNRNILDVPVVGSDEDLHDIYASGYKYAFITVGGICDLNIRSGIYNMLKEIGFIIPNIIDPSASVSNHIEIEDGVFIGKKAIVNAGSTIKKGVIINTAAVIEHDCTIGEFVNIAPGVIVCGEAHIGEKTFIGASSVLKQHIKIGSYSMIGMGSVVLRDIGNYSLAYGNPCKIIRQI